MNCISCVLALVLAVTFVTIPGAAADEKATDEVTAQQIMGNNFIGSRVAAAFYGYSGDLYWPSIKPLYSDVYPSSIIPFSEDTLRMVAKTHILVPGFPLTMAEIRLRVPAAFTPRIYHWRNVPLFMKDDFASKEQVRSQWYLIRKESIPRKALVSSLEEVPRACELVNAMVLYWLAEGETLFPEFVQSASTVDGLRVAVARGNWSKTKLVIDTSRFSPRTSLGEDLDELYGIASMWRPEIQTH